MKLLSTYVKEKFMNTQIQKSSTICCYVASASQDVHG